MGLGNGRGFFRRAGKAGFLWTGTPAGSMGRAGAGLLLGRGGHRALAGMESMGGAAIVVGLGRGYS